MISGTSLSRSHRRRGLAACRRAAFLAALVVGLAAAAPGSRAEEDPASLVQLLSRPGHVAMMRHALAPGTGDPPGLDLSDCSTQRNLSDEGRRQARETGDRLRALGLDQARVFTSAWCRSKDTAALLGYGEPVVAPELNSFFGDRSVERAQTAALIDLMRRAAREGAAIFVTHQVNITAATGVFPASGEMVVLRFGAPEAGVQVVGRASLAEAD